jgi:hypothetical protein
MGLGNPYTPSCQSYECRDRNTRKNVTYVLTCRGNHPYFKELKPWFHQMEVEGNHIEKQTYWACEDCIMKCPFYNEFKYIDNYKIRGLMS